MTPALFHAVTFVDAVTFVHKVAFVLLTADPADV
jgi:hypothetical protein